MTGIECMTAFAGTSFMGITGNRLAMPTLQNIHRHSDSGVGISHVNRFTKPAPLTSVLSPQGARMEESRVAEARADSGQREENGEATTRNPM
jgi:hypothetical protein